MPQSGAAGADGGAAPEKAGTGSMLIPTGGAGGAPQQVPTAGAAEGGRGGAAGEPAAGNGGAACEEGAKRCTLGHSEYSSETCHDGAFAEAVPCQGFCSAGECVLPTSCATAKNCGEQASCCEPVWIEGGGPFEMGWGNGDDNLTTKRSVSGFYLDRFEVTVGRFLEFVNDYESNGIPKPGEGSHPLIAGSGWQSAWEQEPDPYDPLDPSNPDGEKKLAVPKLRAELVAKVSRFEDCSWPTSPNLGASPLPITCVNWFIAFAFCTWDHGRLPTEAEWNFAAAHGTDRLHYPWSVDSIDTNIGPSRAWYNIDQVHVVGSRPDGAARFARYGGLEDLAGNAAEWTLDRFLPVTALDPYHDTPCQDCFEHWDKPNDTRVTRGGGVLDGSGALLTGSRVEQEPAAQDQATGFRCAYDLKGMK